MVVYYGVIVLMILVLLVLHETGHVIAAKALNLRITNIGIQQKPVPHPYVAIEWTPDTLKRNIYFFAGHFITLVVFIILALTGFFGQSNIYYAVALQLVFETNPFYSDFTIANEIRLRTQSEKQSYMFGLTWYVHFALWIGLIILLFSKKYLFSFFF